MKIIILSLIFSGYLASQTVEPFLPEITSQFPGVRDLAISKNGEEIFFTLQSYQQEFAALVYLKKLGNDWQEAQIAPFSGRFQDLEPFFAQDDLRLYFASNRPLSDKETTVKDFDIWYVQRKDLNSLWSSPVNLGPPVNSVHNEFYPSLANNANLYFTSDAPSSKGKDDIYLSVFEKDHYTLPVSLGDSINTEGYEFNAYVAADESFLIFTGYNYQDGLGSGDLYISYNLHGVWSKSRNLGTDINSDKMEYCPYVDVNTQTLYFTSRRNSLAISYPSRQTLKELLDELNKYENGLSRLYKIPFKITGY